MSYFTQVTNTTATPVEVCGVTFAASTPVSLNYGHALFSHADFGRFLAYIEAGDLKGIDAAAADVAVADVLAQCNCRRRFALDPDWCGEKIARAAARGKLIRFDTGEEATPETGVDYFCPDQTLAPGQVMKRRYYSGNWGTSTTLILAATTPGTVVRSAFRTDLGSGSVYPHPIVWTSDYIQSPRVASGALQMVRQYTGANNCAYAGFIDFY